MPAASGDIDEATAHPGGYEYRGALDRSAFGVPPLDAPHRIAQASTSTRMHSDRNRVTFVAPSSSKEDEQHEGSDGKAKI